MRRSLEEDIKTLTALTGKITQGGWFLDEDGPDLSINQIGSGVERFRHVAMVNPMVRVGESMEENKANAEFIALCSHTVPALLERDALLRRLGEKVEMALIDPERLNLLSEVGLWIVSRTPAQEVGMALVRLSAVLDVTLDVLLRNGDEGERAARTAVLELGVEEPLREYETLKAELARTKEENANLKAQLEARQYNLQLKAVADWQSSGRP